MLIEIAKWLYLIVLGGKIEKVNGKRRLVPRINKSSSWFIAMSLMFVGFVLVISVPQSFEVFWKFQQGDDFWRNLKAALEAATVEMATALLLLIALHNHNLTDKERNKLVWFSVYFLVLTVVVQITYYFGLSTSASEMFGWLLRVGTAFLLPYSAFTGAITVAYLWQAHNRADDKETKQSEDFAIVMAAKVEAENKVQNLTTLIEDFKTRLEIMSNNAGAETQRLNGRVSELSESLRYSEQARQEEITRHSYEVTLLERDNTMLREQLEELRNRPPVIVTQPVVHTRPAMTIPDNVTPMRHRTVTEDEDQGSSYRYKFQQIVSNRESNPGWQEEALAVLREAYQNGVKRNNITNWWNRAGTGIDWKEVSEQALKVS